MVFFNNKLLFFISLLFFLVGLLSDLKITSSPKLRLLYQFIILILFLFFNQQIQIDTRIEKLNEIINHQYLRFFFISFFFLVLVNGFNFIDGVNNLSSLNFLIILLFLFLLSKEHNVLEMNKLIFYLILSLSVFVIFNFFGKNFLGDGAVYGLSFLIGTLVIELSIINYSISPYFIANLLLYPAFENLFSIVRRTLLDKKNYIADNNHLHQLIFKYFQKKKIIKKKYLLSSFVGIIINFYLSIIYFLGFLDYSDTTHQMYLIIFNIFSYLTIYYLVKKKIDD